MDLLKLRHKIVSSINILFQYLYCNRKKIFSTRLLRIIKLCFYMLILGIILILTLIGIDVYRVRQLYPIFKSVKIYDNIDDVNHKMKHARIGRIYTDSATLPTFFIKDNKDAQVQYWYYYDNLILPMPALWIFSVDKKGRIVAKVNPS